MRFNDYGLDPPYVKGPPRAVYLIRNYRKNIGYIQ